MNATVFWRIVWKEYRAQRSFGLAMIVLTVVLEVLVILLPPMDTSPTTARADLICVHHVVAMVLGVFYALGVSAILFAAEKDGETYSFLRGLPLRAVEVFAAKTSYALVSTMVLFGALWVIAFGFARALPDAELHRQLWTAAALSSAEFMAWGVLFSLLLQRPLVAVILAVGVPLLLAGIMNYWTPGNLSLETYLRAIPERLQILALLVLVDVLLGLRWLREPRTSTGGLCGILRRDRAKQPSAAEASQFGDRNGPPRLAIFATLLWQDIRQSRAISVALLVTLLPTAVSLLMDLRPPEAAGPFAWVGIVLPILFTPSFFVAPMVGATLFLADQTNLSFRFLAERGIPPRLVWLSRQCRGGLVLILGMLLFLPGLVRECWQSNLADVRWPILATFMGAIVLAYCCGQLCSMAFRSGILAAASGVVVSVILIAWASLMYELRLSWWWSVAPLPISLLVATWLHAPHWLAERNKWRARLLPTLVVAVTLMSILVAIPPLRISQFPVVDPGIDVEQLIRHSSAEEEQTRDLLRRAWEAYRICDSMENSLKPSDSQTEKQKHKEAAAKARASASELALEASRHPLPEAYLAATEADNDLHESELARKLVDRGRELESGNRLDAAWDCYEGALRLAIRMSRHRLWVKGSDAAERETCNALVEWSGRRGQTSERVQHALRRVENLWSGPSSMSDSIKIAYAAELRRVKRAGQAVNGPIVGHSDSYYLTELIHWMPWERTRALRQLNVITYYRLAQNSGLERRLAAGRALAIYNDLPKFDWRPLSDLLEWDFRIPGYDDWPLLSAEARRRTVRLILALESCKLEHGRLPKSLDELKGKYFQSIPQAPFGDGEYRYEPNGLPYAVSWSKPDAAYPKVLAKNRPLLALKYWPIYGPHAEDPLEPLVAGPNTVPAGTDPKLAEEWQSVWVYPIP